MNEADPDMFLLRCKVKRNLPGDARIEPGRHEPKSMPSAGVFHSAKHFKLRNVRRTDARECLPLMHALYTGAECEPIDLTLAQRHSPLQ